MARPFILNADDYGMDADVDGAILELGARGIVTATSAMVLSPAWPEAGNRLHGAPFDCGLHLDFTSPFAARRLAGTTLRSLMLGAYAGRLDRQRLRWAIALQVCRFEDVLGRPPDFVDGHQHVHQLPMIRTALLEVLSDRYGTAARDVRVRFCAPRQWRGIKAAVVAAAGARGMERLATARGHAGNSDFAGVYNFSPNANLAAHWRRWLPGLAGKRPLIMCHVALPGEAHPADPIRAARHREFAWLRSGAFADLLAEVAMAPASWYTHSHG